MTRAELEHAIRAACQVAGDTELWIFGSQAILGQFPDASEQLRESAECDVTPKNRPEAADKVDAALGELSPFHSAFGFYVHGLSLDAATLPDGWKERTHRVQNENTKQYVGHCVEVHDLAASKLVAYRDKDLEFVRILLIETLIAPDTLKQRIQSLPCDAALRTRITTWVEATVADLDPQS